MTEPVGTSNVMNPPPPPTAEAAEVRRQEMLQDPAFMERVGAKDAAAFDEYNKIWRQARGMTPEPVPPANPDQVRAQMHDTDRILDDARLATWENLTGMDDQQRFEHRRGLATAQQVADAKLAVERMKKDAAFRVRVLNGDRDAVRQWLLAGRVASMQIAPPDHDWSKTT